MPETNPPQPVCPDRCLSHPSAGPPLTATMRATTAFLLLGLLARWVPLAACRRRLPLCLVALPPALPPAALCGAHASRSPAGGEARSSPCPSLLPARSLNCHACLPTPLPARCCCCSASVCAMAEETVDRKLLVKPDREWRACWLAYRCSAQRMCGA